MRPRAQRRNLQSPMLRNKSERIDADVVVNVLTAEQRRKVVVVPGEQRVTAEFPIVTPARQAHRLSQMQTVLSRLPRQDRRLPEPLNHVVDPCPHVRGICKRLLQIARELRPQMTGQFGRKAAQQRQRSALRSYVLFPVRTHREVCNRTGRIEKHIIRPVITRRVHACRKKVLRRQ